VPILGGRRHPARCGRESGTPRPGLAGVSPLRFRFRGWRYKGRRRPRVPHPRLCSSSGHSSPP